MGIFRRIGDRLFLFFRVDIPIWFSRLSVGTKLLFIIPAVMLMPLLYYVIVASVALPFAFVMSCLTSNESYEFLQPISKITCVEIVCIIDEIWLYSHPVSEIPEMLDEAIGSSINLEESQYSTFWSDFREVQCKEWWNDPSPEISDGTIWIQYTDGSQEWISAGGTFFYESSTEKISMTNYYFDGESFSAFLEKYGYPSS